MHRVFLRLGLLLAIVTAARAQPAALSVNTASREEVRQFFRTVFFASENVPMAWTGNYASANAGDTSSAFKEATRLRINFFRALVGVPADITFNATYSLKAQQTALLMSVNDQLSHTPPPTWTLYSSVAAEGAINSNLALGQAGPDAIGGYVADAGSNNAVVGHRRWLFFPQTLRMGTGDVPGVPGNNSLRPANAVWVIDTTPGGQFDAPRPTTRTTAVPYPPAGYVPYQLVWPRWSFSYPNADFASATVAMTRNGQSVPVRIEPLGSNVGEPTLVWVYDNRDTNTATAHPKPAADTTYAVTVSNVRVAGAPQTFSYNVTVFDPDVAAADFQPVTVTGSALPTVGAANRYAVTKPSFAPAFEWRSVQLSPATQTFTAESGLEGLTGPVAPGYSVVQTMTVATGSRSYRLAHFDPRVDQGLLLPGTYFVGNGAAITFRSRLAVATATETARVQVSTDDGLSWSDVYAQGGTSATDTGFPAPTDALFVARTVSLSAYAGHSVRVRFQYTTGFGVTFVPDETNTVGWFLDDIALAGVQAISAGAATRANGGATFDFTPASPGATGLQARGVMFDAYPMEWGPVLSLTAVGGTPPPATSYLSNLSVRSSAGTGAQTLIVGFAVSDGSKPLVVRGVGPALVPFGVSNALADPRLEVYQGAAKIYENDNWLAGDASTFGRVGAFSLANGSRDAALVVDLPPASYTAQVSGAAGGTGVALVELYDAAAGTSAARLSNVSARSQVGTGGEILIAGFNVSGTGTKKLLLRAVGPALANFGVTGALSDPKLELFDASGKIQENDNWEPATRATFAQVGAFELPTGSQDAVLLVTLPPGSYTAQVSGVGGTTGVALVEVYEVP